MKEGSMDGWLKDSWVDGWMEEWKDRWASRGVDMEKYLMVDIMRISVRSQITELLITSKMKHKNTLKNRAMI